MQPQPDIPIAVAKCKAGSGERPLALQCVTGGPRHIGTSLVRRIRKGPTVLTTEAKRGSIDGIDMLAPRMGRATGRALRLLCSVRRPFRFASHSVPFTLACAVAGMCMGTRRSGLGEDALVPSRRVTWADENCDAAPPWRGVEGSNPCDGGPRGPLSLAANRGKATPSRPKVLAHLAIGLLKTALRAQEASVVRRGALSARAQVVSWSGVSGALPCQRAVAALGLGSGMVRVCNDESIGLWRRIGGANRVSQRMLLLRHDKLRPPSRPGPQSPEDLHTARGSTTWRR